MTTTLGAGFDRQSISLNSSACKIAVVIIVFLISFLTFAVSFSEAQVASDFTLTATPASVRIARNGKGSVIITTAILHGFQSSVALAATGAPAGITLGYSRSSIASPGAGSSALTFSVSKLTPLGTYPITVTAGAGATTHTATVTLTVVESLSLPTGFGWYQLANTNMTSVCLGNVADGMYSDTTMTTTKNYDFDCYQIVPWSSGVGDTVGNRMIVWGGGHSDYAGDEVQALGLTSNPPAWTEFLSPTYPVPWTGDGKNWEGLNPYFVRAADGGTMQQGATPASRHTYAGVVFVPTAGTAGRMYSFGGSLANAGGYSAEIWYLDMASGTWTLTEPYSQLSASTHYTTAYNPTTGHVIVYDAGTNLYDYNPSGSALSLVTGNFPGAGIALSPSVYGEGDGSTSAVDPVNNQLVVVWATDCTTSSVGSCVPNNPGYPTVPNYTDITLTSLTTYATTDITSTAGCDLVYRNGGIAWDSELGLMVGYPGGGNQVYLLNTGAQNVVTPFGTVASHQCLDVPISLNPSPVKGVDYPQDPEGTPNGDNIGIYGRFAYLPSLDMFGMVNDGTQNAWTLQLTGGSPAPNFTVSISPIAVPVQQGSQGTATVSTTVSGGFNNAISLSAVGVPAGTTVSFSPSTIAAPGAGNSTMTFNVGASTVVGTYPITVSVNGGGDTQNPIATLIVTSSGQPNFTLAALPASLSVAQGNQGTSTITATIVGSFNSAISLSASGVPSGTTVSFNPQIIPAPGAGSSTMNITVGSSTATGTYPITVTGNGGGIQQTTTFTLTVIQQGSSFAISASPALLSIPQGNQGTSTITTTLSGGFNSAVTLSASGVPSGTTVSFNPNPIPAPGSGNSTMTVTVGSNTSSGTYPITVTGNGGGVQQSTTVTLTVTTGGANFSISATPASLTIVQGNQGATVIATTVSGGFSSAISLSASGVPSGTTVSFNPNPIPAPGAGSSGMTVTVGASTAVGTYPITVTGSGGGIQQNTTLTLTVSPAQLPRFTISAAPASLSITQGNQGISTITTAVSGGFNSAVILSASGVPSGTTVSFNPNPIPAPGSGSSTMTITVGSSTPAGTYPITVMGNGGGIQESTAVTLTVTAGTASYTISASPVSLSIQQGNQGTSTITTTISGGFNSAITLSVSGVPSGTTVSFNPNPVPAPGSGNSTMTVTVGSSTAPGTYPITVTGNGGGIQQNATVTLTVLPSIPWSIGLDFRNSAGFVTDPPGDSYVLSTTAYPTKGSGVTYGWVKTSLVSARDRNAQLDPRLAGINYASNGSPATFYVDLPSAGSYNLSLAMGDAGYQQCYTQCQIQFLDGSTVLATLSKGLTPLGYFYDTKGNNWSAAKWPANNVSQQVTLSGSRLTVVVGLSQGNGDITPLAFLGVTQVSGSPNFVISASPASITLQQGKQGTSTITTTIGGGFNSAITLSASGVPSGTTVSFSPNPIPAPGSGNPTMNITVGASTVPGTYPITVTGNGGGVQQNTTVTLTVTAAPNFAISASPAALSIKQGNQGTSTITTTVSGGFNNAVTLSASGVPSGTTVSFNPDPIPAPGSGNSIMNITVGASTAAGTYPITVTGNGGGIQQNTTVTLTVTSAPNFTISASPASLSIQQGNQGTSTITTTVSGGFNSAITLSASGVPSGTTVSFNPNPIPAPGSGSANMTITVGSSTAVGTYPITVAGNGGGIQQNTTVTLTVSSGGAWQQGFDFRNTSTFVTDPAGDTYVLSTTAYPTKGSGVTYGWVKTSLVGGRDRNAKLDPRLAGINYATNGSPATFYVDLPSSGTYNLALAAGDAGYQACWVQCQVQFLDGSTVLSTLTLGSENLGYFYDAQGKNWSAASWPSSNLSQQVTLAGTRLTVVVGTNKSTGDVTPLAFLGVTQVSSPPNFAISASPASLSVAQGNQGTSTITTTIGGGFNSAVTLSASGVPSGTTVSFNPNPIPAPGSGNSTLTMTVGASTGPGTYPITVTGNGGGVQQNTTVTLTVTAAPNFTISASPAALSIQQGNQGTSTITTTVSGGFNSAITLSASGVPSGTTVSFNPNPIPAPGSGNSTMTITVGSGTAAGAYPITLTGSGGGIQQNATVSLTVTSASGGGPSGNGIAVYSTSGSPQANRFVSIGRFFKQGDIPHFAQAVVGGTAILTQCDVKNRWADGSLKFAIVSFIVPSVATSGTPVTFQDQGTGNNTGFLQQSDMLNSAYDFDGVIQLTGTISPSVSARSMLQAGAFRYWLQGPIVTAVILEDRNNRTFDVNTDGGSGNPLHPIIEAWFYPQSHQVEVGFTLENSWASSTAANSARNQTYALALTTGFNSPATQLTQGSFTQIIFSRWRRAFWVDSTPAPIQINYNWPYLASTGAYAHFNSNYTPDESDLESMYSVYTNEPAGRLTIPGIDALYGDGGIVNYDENPNGPGYAPWIGPYSQWDVDYLMTGDSRMQQMMTDNADLSGRYPIFFREADHNAGTGMYFDAPGTGSVDPYGHVVSINARQYATLNLANLWDYSCNNNGADFIATAVPSDGSAWYQVPGDTSHLADFAYIPYTLTGKYFYLEHETLEAGFAAGHGIGCYSATGTYGREGHYGMLYSATREMAWALRTMAYAAFMAPDGTPEGPYFSSKIINNIAMLEGEHALPLTVSGADPTWAYNWGGNYFQYSQAANPSTLSFWRMGDCQDGTSTCYVANGQGANNNINAAVIQSAESGFMSSFIDIVLGMVNQLGIVDTSSILQRNARRYFNILLNPAVNHYLVEQYVYPTTLVGTVCQNPANPGCQWVSDWATFQSGYLSLPTGWSTRQVDYGAEAASALSFMTKFTVDGYSGLNAWNFFTTSDSTQLGLVYHNEPQWSISPMQ